MDLATQYLGLSLKNPLIVGSSGLSKTADQVKRLEEAGAGAVVLKSLFEEQIRAEESDVSDSLGMHTEVLDYLRAEIDMSYGPRDYLETIRQAKKQTSIPVIASVNCATSKWWVSYAKQIEAAGADALELNVYILPYDFSQSSDDLEAVYLDVMEKVRAEIKIPVAMKLSPYFTSFGYLAKGLANRGANGLVLFNRFVQPDIDLKNIATKVRAMFNDPIGFSYALRWVAMLSETVDIDIAASGNIKSADDMIKQILAGAAAVQIVSLFYKEGAGKIKELLENVQNWMREHEFSSLSDFRGKLNQKNNPLSQAFVRAQYMKAISGGK
ncbi:MAG: dihydroorotate dehydrogenase-like protein [Calditrichaeota bacterium]|nr:dihydroorotate dehydrogenase-like protein [Calditrichota bacterium]